MKITASEGKNGKIHVSVDGEYLLTVDSDFWYSCGYGNNAEINSAELEAFISSANARRAFNSAMYSLDIRDHSEKEIRIKLSRKFDNEAVDNAVEKLLDLKLIDDERYAENLAEELYERKKYGKNRIRTELFRRGIDSETVNYVLDELFEDNNSDNVERIVDIIQKKYYNKISDENGRKKVFAALTRLGYSFSDIREALRAFSDDEYFEE